MAFGSFREVAVLEEPIETTNETGEFIQTWVCFAKVRASIVSMSANQQAMMDQTVPTASWRFEMRWIPGRERQDAGAVGVGLQSDHEYQPNAANRPPPIHQDGA